MKMNPVNIPWHEAGHVVACQQLRIPMTHAIATSTEAGTYFDKNKGPLNDRLCAVVAGHISEHLFGVEEGRFPLISDQLDHPDFRCFQEDDQEDLACAKHYASVMNTEKLKSERDFILAEEKRACCFLKKHEPAVRAIANELTKLGKIRDKRAKELLTNPSA